MGIVFEITGTTTKYVGGNYSMPPMNGMSRTNPIQFFHYKSFEENWIAVRQRIVHTGSRHHNVDGEVVEYAAFRLAQRKESRKIIFSLSDGEPCAGHNNDSEMCQNLKRVCERVRKAGIEVYGFGIETEAPAAFYGRKFFIFLEKVEQMGQDFVRKFADVITGGRVRV
jgi:cobalamin biosynthesis protein CobT